jgi:hypothetical protein
VETKQVFRIDADGFYVEDVILYNENKNDKGPPKWNVPIDCVESKPPEGMFVLKWDGKEWTEGISQTEVDQRRTDIAKQQEQGKAKAYLNETDWYIARYVETSKAVPDDVKTKREDMRNVLNP